MCFQQESTINRLKDSLDLMKDKQQIEIDLQVNEVIINQLLCLFFNLKFYF